MALTPSIQVTQAKALVTSNFSAGEVQAAQLRAMAIVNFPTETVEASQVKTEVVAKSIVNTQVSKVGLLLVGLGRSSDPTVRAWTFTLDQHDFYVLRLGDQKTLVLDLMTGQWSTWKTSNLPFWRAGIGMNWLGGMQLASDRGSNVVVLDDWNGTVWFLDPALPYDQDFDDPEVPVPFSRRATAQIPVRGRQVLPCFDVFLTADVGAPALNGDTVLLEYSDDAGKSYTEAGYVTITPDNFNQEIYWMSLGQIEAPGRLFRITDYGAVTRSDRDWET